MTPPAVARLAISADPSFRGDPDLHNPEQLLLAAASSCQMLSFLALAAIIGIDVISYSDEAQAEMPVVAGPMRITRILLRPRIVVALGTDLEKAHRLVHQGHDECYIANTIKAEIVIEATIEFTE